MNARYRAGAMSSLFALTLCVLASGCGDANEQRDTNAPRTRPDSVAVDADSLLRLANERAIDYLNKRREEIERDPGSFARRRIDRVQRIAELVGIAGEPGTEIALDGLRLPPEEGPWNQRTVREREAASLPDIVGCLAVDPSLRGVVVVRFTIASDGDVSDAYVVRANLGDRRVEYCIADIVGTWQFAPEDTTATYDWPFVFE